MKKDKEKINLVSMVVGIVMILVGLGWTSIIISTFDYTLAFPLILLFVGAFLSLMGGLRRW